MISLSSIFSRSVSVFVVIAILSHLRADPQQDNDCFGYLEPLTKNKLLEDSDLGFGFDYSTLVSRKKKLLGLDGATKEIVLPRQTRLVREAYPNQYVYVSQHCTHTSNGTNSCAPALFIYDSKKKEEKLLKRSDDPWAIQDFSMINVQATQGERQVVKFGDTFLILAPNGEKMESISNLESEAIDNHEIIHTTKREGQSDVLVETIDVKSMKRLPGPKNSNRPLSQSDHGVFSDGKDFWYLMRSKNGELEWKNAPMDRTNWVKRYSDNLVYVGPKNEQDTPWDPNTFLYLKGDGEEVKNRDLVIQDGFSMRTPIAHNRRGLFSNLEKAVQPGAVPDIQFLKGPSEKIDYVIGDKSGKVALVLTSEGFYLVSLQSKKFMKVPSSVNQVIDFRKIEVNSDGSRVLYADDRGGGFFDLSRNFHYQSHDKRPFTRNNTASEIFFTSGKNDISKFVLNCGPETRIEAVDTECATCNGSLGEQDPTLVDELELTTLCKAQFEPEQWNRFTGKPSTNRPLNQVEVGKFLNRFQKKGGFDPKIHTRLFRGILKNEKIVDSYKEDVARALISVYATDPTNLDILGLAREDLIRLVRGIKKFKFDGGCHGESERALLSGVIADVRDLPYMDYPNAANALKNSQKEVLSIYGPLLVAGVPKDEMADIVDSLAETLVEETLKSVPNVDRSKLYQFGVKEVLKQLGLPTKDKIDSSLKLDTEGIFSDSANDNIFQLSIFGNKNLSVGTLSSDGELTIHYDRKINTPIGTFSNLIVDVGRFEGERHAEFRLRGVLDGKDLGKMRATFKSKRAESSTYDFAPKPNYEDIWKDGTLNGVILISDNLASSDTVTDNYINYFSRNGYKFEPGKTVGTASFVESTFSENEVDFAIKEAHSAGSDRFFTSSSRSTLLVGEKDLGNNRKERIQILSPIRGGGFVSFNNRMLAESISRRNRESFLYFNTTCRSEGAAKNEIAAVGSKRITVIPSKSGVRTFTNQQPSGIRYILDTLRVGGSYQDIRNRMTELDSNFESRGKDRFIFPDDRDYEWLLNKRSRYSVSTEVEFFDVDGKVVDRDQLNDKF